MALASKVTHQEASPRALVGKVRESPGNFVKLIIGVILVDVTAVIVGSTKVSPHIMIKVNNA
jgi:hypothetical protein